MTKITVSVVVAVRNGARTVQRCIDSVCGQTYPHTELIVVDGQSTDGTVEILHKNDDAIAWQISEPDTGIYHAWNKALAHAKGDWICFLGADDYLWDSRVLERMAGYLANGFPRVRVVYGQVALVNEFGDVLGWFGRPWSETRSMVLSGAELNIHQGTFHHRNLFEIRGQFDESFRIAGDYEMLLREVRNNAALYVPHPVAAMQHGGISSNPYTKVVSIKEIIRARHMHQLPLRGDLVAAYIRANVHAMLCRVLGRKISALAADSYRALTGKPRLWTGRHC